MRRIDRRIPWSVIPTAATTTAALILFTPVVVLAQASPFETGAESLVDFALSIATPIAILIVIGIAIAAAVGRVSAGIAIVCIVAIAAVFGAPQIVTWIQDMFGV